MHFLQSSRLGSHPSHALICRNIPDKVPYFVSFRQMALAPTAVGNQVDRYRCVTERIAKVHNDDQQELYMRPALTAQVYVHFTANSISQSLFLIIKSEFHIRDCQEKKKYSFCLQQHTIQFIRISSKFSRKISTSWTKMFKSCQQGEIDTKNSIIELSKEDLDDH
jgi:hypothetical protein